MLETNLQNGLVAFAALAIVATLFHRFVGANVQHHVAVFFGAKDASSTGNLF